MKPSTEKNARGFTLIEVLVALTILSLLSLMAFRGLGAVLDARAHVQEETDKWLQVGAFFTRLEQDVRMAAPRSVRSPGGQTPAWLGNMPLANTPLANTETANTELSNTEPANTEPAGTTPLLVFSRFASVEGVDAPRRVGYSLNQQQDIELWLWPGLDVPTGTTAARYPVLHGVKTLEFQYMGSEGLWVNHWPVSTRDNAIPRALRLRMVLTSGEDIIRVLATGL
ncbi:MAG TPA: type II secretion system protein GspJ [Pseudomonadales bacterium]|nr:type II secretion system protein GspJ [Pseudomonadales bacterium]